MAHRGAVRNVRALVVRTEERLGFRLRRVQEISRPRLHTVFIMRMIRT